GDLLIADDHPALAVEQHRVEILDRAEVERLEGQPVVVAAQHRAVTADDDDPRAPLIDREQLGDAHAADRRPVGVALAPDDHPAGPDRQVTAVDPHDAPQVHGRRDHGVVEIDDQLAGPLARATARELERRDGEQHAQPSTNPSTIGHDTRVVAAIGAVLYARGGDPPIGPDLAAV